MRVLAVYALARLFSALVLAEVARFQSASTWTPEHPGYGDMLGLWDATWYEKIATEGYPSAVPLGSAGDPQQSALAFYPVAPLLARLLMTTGLSFPAAGALVSLVTGAAAAVGIEALLRRGVDVLHLGVGRGLLRTDLLEVRADLVGRGLGAGGAGVEVRVAEVLRKHRDRHAVVATAARGAVGVVPAAGGEDHRRAEAQRRESGCPLGEELHRSYLPCVSAPTGGSCSAVPGVPGRRFRRARIPETPARTLGEITEATSSSPIPKTTQSTQRSDRASEAGGLAVFTPLRAQGVADLAEGRLGPAGLQHRLDHVLLGAADLDQPRQRGVDGCLVAAGLALGEAMAAALDCDPSFDIASALAGLAEAGAITALHVGDAP